MTNPEQPFDPRPQRQPWHDKPPPVDPQPPAHYPDYGPAYPSPAPFYPPPYHAGPPGYPGYVDPYDPYRSTRPGTNGLAIGSLATSIASVFLAFPLTWFCFVGLLIPITGIGLGIAALNQIKRTGQPGRGLAIAGIAVGAAALVLVIVGVLVTIALVPKPSY